MSQSGIIYPMSTTDAVGTPGGQTKQFQFNDDGVFGGTGYGLYDANQQKFGFGHEFIDFFSGDAIVNISGAIAHDGNEVNDDWTVTYGLYGFGILQGVGGINSLNAQLDGVLENDAIYEFTYTISGLVTTTVNFQFGDLGTVVSDASHIAGVKTIRGKYKNSLGGYKIRIYASSYTGQITSMSLRKISVGTALDIFGDVSQSKNVSWKLQANIFKIVQDNVDLLTIDPTSGNQLSSLYAYDPSDGSRGSVYLNSSNNFARFIITSLAATDNSLAEIEGKTEPGELSFLKYTADSHIFDGAIFKNVTVVSSNYTVAANDYFIVATLAADIQLPATGPDEKRILVIKNASGAATVNAVANGIETFDDGPGTFAIEAGECLTIQASGTNWYVISRYIPS